VVDVGAEQLVSRIYKPTPAGLAWNVAIDSGLDIQPVPCAWTTHIGSCTGDRHGTKRSRSCAHGSDGGAFRWLNGCHV